MSNKFGQAFAELLGASGLSQRDFSVKVGMSQANISKILNGKTRTPPPPPDVIRVWCEAIDYTDAERLAELAREDLLEQSRDEVQAMVNQQKLELASLRKKVADLEQETINLGVELMRLRAKKS